MRTLQILGDWLGSVECIQFFIKALCIRKALQVCNHLWMNFSTQRSFPPKENWREKEREIKEGNLLNLSELNFYDSLWFLSRNLFSHISWGVWMRFLEIWPIKSHLLNPTCGMFILSLIKPGQWNPIQPFINDGLMIFFLDWTRSVLRFSSPILYSEPCIHYFTFYLTSMSIVEWRELIIGASLNGGFFVVVQAFRTIILRTENANLPWFSSRLEEYILND